MPNIAGNKNAAIADKPRDAFVQTILLIWPEMVLNSTSGQNTVVVVVVVVVMVVVVVILAVLSHLLTLVKFYLNS